MALKTNIFIETTNLSLKNALSQIISDDWSLSWTIIDRDQQLAYPENTDIAVIDRTTSLKLLRPETTKVFIGKPDVEDNSFFTILDSYNVDRVFKEVRRAFSHREILTQNQNALVPQLENSDCLAELAQSLSAKINHLIRQSEMRVALVDQLPVGVIGIDDENTVVLVNPKAIEVLSIEDVPVWGMSIDHLMSRDVKTFVADDTRKSMHYQRFNETIVIQKSEFMLDNKFAGTILVLTEHGH